MKISTGLRLTAAALALSASWQPAQAHAQSQTQERQFDIQAQAASTGIQRLAAATGLQIIISAEDASGRRIAAVRGQMTPREAVRKALQGTDLQIVSDDGRTLVVKGGRAPVKPEQTAVAKEPAEAPAPIIVTGSRVVSDMKEATAPATVVSEEQLDRVGSGTAYDLLRRVPFVAMGEGSPNNNGDPDNGGAAFMNLRNLGANRSLTLVNGRRRVSGGSNLSGVDLNMIPSGMISRVDIVTGGTSAVYGADAVTGVTNIILKNDFDGLEGSVRMGQAEHGGADQYFANILGGTGFDDGRGQITIGASYFSRSGLMQEDRDFAANLTGNYANPANTGPNDGIPDRLDYDDVRWIYASYDPNFYYKNKAYIIEDGSVREAKYDTQITTGATSYGNGGDGRNINDTRKLIEPVETISAVANVSYDVSDSITAYLSGEYTHSYSNGWFNYYRADDRSSYLNGYGGLQVTLENPFLPDSVRQFMEDNGLSTLKINKSYREFGMITNVHNRDLFNVEAGLRGELGSKFDWSVFGQFGKSNDYGRSDNVPLAKNLIYASEVITDTNGDPICANEAARKAGCVPFNIFANEISDEARDYILHTRRYKALNSLVSFGGQIQGDAFELPAGPVRLAAGAEYRKEGLKTIDDPLSLNGEASHAATWRDPHPDIDVSFEVAEAFAEVHVPLLAAMPFMHELSVDGAYRYSHYNTIGTTGAWKIGGLWAPVADLRFRGSVSRSVRAPNLFELFGPTSSSLTNPSDPCEVGQYNSSAQRAANCAALGISAPLPLDQSPVEFTSGSNADLTEETSNSWTAGFLFTPGFLPGLSISADYWDISIDNAVQSYSFQNIINYCTNLSSVENAFCSQVDRDPVTKQIVSVRGTSINVAELKARGVDFSLNLRQPLAGGTVDITLNGTRLIEKTSQLVPGEASFLVQQDGGLSDPRLRANLIVGYSRDAWSVFITNRYLSKVKVDPMASEEYYQFPTAAARLYTNLDVTFDLSSKLKASVGVNNLLDVEPPYSSSNTTIVGNYGLYDTIGRYFKFGLSARF
ncbi:MAG TPA: TonB-dependent receptor [Sphingomonadaceae bacterium]|nr:TonB-dependent receptor [Sphingomonadaceae bacterium]